MNLNQLEYFVTVADTLNFTKAAAQCYISQTAMTQQIKALEKQVGVPLFVRDKHHVELTAAGRIYLQEVRVILDRSNDAIRMARMASEGVQGEITIGYINGYGQSDFGRLLKKFYRAYPNVKINLIRNNMSVLVDELMKKACDIVFVTHAQREYPELQKRYLKSYPVYAVLPEGHALASKKFLSYQELQSEDFIMMQPKTRPKDQMEESMLIYERGGYLPNIVGVEGEQETLLLMIAAGMGISIMPEYIMRNYPQGKDIVCIPLLKTDGTAESLDLEVFWSQENVNPAVEQLLEMM